MSGYTDMHNNVLKSKAAASKKEEDKKAAEEAEKRAKADEAVKSAPVAAKKQEEQTKEIVKPVEKIEETFIENSTEAVANAKVGDKLKRNDGKEVTLTQADIDAAKAELAPKEPEVKTDANGFEIKENNDDDLFQDDMIKSEVEMSEESKQATKELANSFGVPLGKDANEESIKAFVDSGNAIAAKDALTGEFTDKDGKPVDEETFKTSIFPSEKPEDAMNWFQNIAPALTVLSLVITTIGMANGVPIIPINFNKISNRDEAYEAYTEIMVEDQKQKNADTNAIETPFQLQERKEQYERETGKSADDVIEGYGKFNEAGQMAVNKEQNKFAFDMSDKEQANALEQMEKSGELEQKRMEVEQRLAIETMSEENKNQLALMYAQAENNAEMAQLMHNLEANLNADSIKALQDAGLSVNQYARWMKAQGGRTAADTVNDYIQTVGGVATSMVGNMKDTFKKGVDALNPL